MFLEQKLNYIVVSYKSWTQKIFDDTISKYSGQWFFIEDKKELNITTINNINPRYIFFLHWSWKVLGAQKAGQKIAVEIKSFLRESTITDFHLALGQTLNYRSALRKKEPERILYLAITLDIYENFFSYEFIQEVLQEHQLKLLIFCPEEQEVSLWKE